MSATHKQLVDRAVRWVQGRGFKAVFSEIASYNHTGEIPDVLGFASGRSLLVEVKTSRSDFLADKRKRVRRLPPDMGMGNERYYFAPVGVIDPAEVPQDWGLVEYYPDSGSTRTVVYASRTTANLGAERSFLYSVVRRAILRCGLDPCECRTVEDDEKVGGTD